MEDISITVIRLLRQELEQIIEEGDRNVTQAEAEERRRKKEEEKQQRVMERKTISSRSRRQMKREAILKEVDDQWKHQEAQIEKRLKEKRIDTARTSRLRSPN